MMSDEKEDGFSSQPQKSICISCKTRFFEIPKKRLELKSGILNTSRTQSLSKQLNTF
jgi:hypothetical protein